MTSSKPFDYSKWDKMAKETEGTFHPWILLQLKHKIWRRYFWTQILGTNRFKSNSYFFDQIAFSERFRCSPGKAFAQFVCGIIGKKREQCCTWGYAAWINQACSWCEQKAWQRCLQKEGRSCTYMKWCTSDGHMFKPQSWSASAI